MKVCLTGPMITRNAYLISPKPIINRAIVKPCPIAAPAIFPLWRDRHPTKTNRQTPTNSAAIGLKIESNAPLDLCSFAINCSVSSILCLFSTTTYVRCSNLIAYYRLIRVKSLYVLSSAYVCVYMPVCHMRVTLIILTSPFSPVFINTISSYFRQGGYRIRGSVCRFKESYEPINTFEPYSIIHKRTFGTHLFVWFDSLRPINNLSVV